MNAVCMFSSEPDMAKEFVEQQSQLIAVLK